MLTNWQTLQKMNKDNQKNKQQCDACSDTVHCCSICDHLGYAPPQHDQPYPEVWCGKGHFDGISSYDELHEPTECKDYYELK
jgi:tetrahydromethanopterin S-methyltransferase subunit H